LELEEQELLMDALKVRQEMIQFSHQSHQLVVEVVVLPTHLLESQLV
tara:strand:+ start:357 stop:497 length:141 start_codon:yes stop_codon:yes gene_type:complete